MQRFFTVCAAVMMLSLAAHAENMDAPRFELGLRGGVSFSNWSYYDCDALAAPQGGLSLAFRVARVPLYLETGVYYMDKGARIEEWGNDEYYWGNDWDDWGDGYRYGHSDRRYYNSHQPTLQIPLLVSYHHYFTPSFSIRPFMGVYVAPVLNTDDGEYFEDNVDVGFKVGCGLGVGAFYGGISCDLSSAGYDYDWDYESNATLSLTVGVNFTAGGSKSKPRQTEVIYIH